MTHIAVIGAGITGVTTAYDLVDRGFEVTVVDRHRYAAMETSYANGGQLSASNAEVWTHWATVIHGLRWMLQSDAPLLVHPTPTWHKLSWMAEFLTAIPRYRANTVATAKMAIAARPVLMEMAVRAGVDFDHSAKGILHVYRSAKALAKARRVTEMLAEGGLHRREVSAAEIREIEPTLSGDFAGGFLTDSDSTGDIHLFTTGLADWLAAQGVTMRFGTAIVDAAARDDQVELAFESGEAARFDGVVVSAGIASRDFAHRFGDRVNVYPVKGYSITVHLDDAASRRAAPQVSLLDDAAKIVSSRLGEDRFRIAGTAEFAGTNRDIRDRRVRPLVRWCETLFPGVSTERVVPWAGLRPMMPDMMPRVGRGSHPRVFYNTGHGHLGWTLSGATARMVGGVVAEAMREARAPQAGRATRTA